MRFIAWFRRVGNPVRWPRSFVTMTLPVFGTFTVAGSSLLLEMATQNWCDFTVTTWISRSIVTMISFLLLMRFLWVRLKQSRNLGTLYYVRALPGWMKDNHQEVIQERGAKYSDKRIISQNLNQESTEGVVDWTKEANILTLLLQTAMVSDTYETGFDIATNALFPVAMAIGYDAILENGTRLVETNPASNAPAGESFETWHPLSLTGEPLLQSRIVFTENPGVVLIQAHLTPPTPILGVSDLKTKVQVMLHLSDDKDQAVGATISQRVPESGKKHQTYTFQWAARSIAQAIIKTLAEFPDARVYLDCRAPKSVCFAVGNYLSGSSGEEIVPRKGSREVRDIWQRLIPIVANQNHRDFAPSKRCEHWLVTRVHPDQPSLTQLAAWRKADGLPL